MRKLKILAFALCSLAVFWGAGYLSLTKIKPFEIRSLLNSDDPVRIEYETYLKIFDDRRDITALLAFPEDMTDSDLLYDANVWWDQKLFHVPHLTHAKTLTTAEYLKLSDDSVRFERFFENKRLRRAAREHLSTEAFKNSYLSAKGDAFLIHLQMDSNLSVDKQEALIARLNTIAIEFKQKFPQAAVHLLGYTMVRHHFTQELYRNQNVVSPLVFFLVGCILFFMLRSWAMTFLSLYMIALCYALNLCFVIWYEDGVGPYSAFALVFVFIVAVADLVHFFTKLANAPAGTINEKLAYVRKSILRPCFYTCITTIIGFLSLLVSNSVPVHNLGLHCAVGTTICFVATFFLLPHLVRLLLPHPRRVAPPAILSIERYPRWILKHRRWVILFAVVFTAIATIPVMHLNVDDNFYGKFVSTHPMSQAVHEFQERLGFIAPIEITLQMKSDGQEYYSPQAVKHIEKLKQDIEKIPGVVQTRSAWSFFNYIDWVRRHATSAPATCEGGFQGVNICRNIIDLFKRYEILDEYLGDDGRTQKMQIYLGSMQASTLLKVQSEISQLLKDQDFSAVFSGKISGFSTIRTHIVNGIKRDLLDSFAFSYVMIFGFFLLLLRSLRLAILAMIPNIMPVMVLAGCMGLSGIMIDDNIIILLNVVLGIAVDDTIHFLTAFEQRARQTGAVFITVLDETLKDTSPALIGMNLNFILTVPAFALMNLILFKQIAVFLCIVLALALVYDFFLMPLLLPNHARPISK